MQLIFTIVTLLWLFVTWVLFIRRTYISVHYGPTIIYLALSSAGFAYLSNLLISTRSIAIIGFFISFLCLVLLVLKILQNQNSLMQSGRKFFRSTISIDPYPIGFEIRRDESDLEVKFRNHYNHSVDTDDGVNIQITCIESNHDKLIIIAHGAFRNRFTAPYVILAQWLAYKYDVILMDFRGHGESNGFFDFSEATTLDLKAVIEYSKTKGYKKIGVLARSMGAWTALLEAAKYQNIDSIIAAASPLGQITDINMAKRMKKIIDLPFLGIVIAPLAQVLASLFKQTRISSFGTATQCPYDVAKELGNIPVFLIYHEDDRVIETTKSGALKLYNALPGEKSLLILAGKGHIFELAQFSGLYQRIDDWFERTLK